MGISGIWILTMKTPMGMQKGSLTLAVANREITGTLSMPGNPTCNLTQGKLVGKTATMQGRISNPIIMNLSFRIDFEDDMFAGTCDSGMVEPFQVTGMREQASVDGRGLIARWKDFLFN